MKNLPFVLVILLLIGIFICLFLSNAPSHSNSPIHITPLFSFSPIQTYMLDNDNATSSRIALDAYVQSKGNVSSEIDLIALPEKPLDQVYYVSDYPFDSTRWQIFQNITQELSIYSIHPQSVSALDSLSLSNTIIIIPTESMPDAFLSGNLYQLASKNVVIFFGEPLDVVMDTTSAKSQVGNQIYSSLELTQSLVPLNSNSSVFSDGQSTFVQYPNGSLILTQPNLVTPLILNESWQTLGITSTFSNPNTGIHTFFSVPTLRLPYFIRVIYHSNNISGIDDLGSVQNLPGTLELSPYSGSAINYSYFLYSNFTTSVHYTLSLEFLKNNNLTYGSSAGSVIMKTYASGSSSIQPNISPGDYSVLLIDSEGITHAQAYLHISNLSINLIRISNNIHTFQVLLDGEPVENDLLPLSVNNQTLQIRTDSDGLANVPMILSPGVYAFTVEQSGNYATIYYLQKQDNSNLLLYFVFGIGFIFLTATTYAKSRTPPKFLITTHSRHSISFKRIKISYPLFFDLFLRIQAERSPGLPLSIADIGMGIRKYSMYNGASLYVTDSNIFHVLDSLAKKKKMLSCHGYYLPFSLSQNKSIEYWYMKRRIFDALIRNGETGESEDSEYFIRGKRLHLWPDLEPKRIVDGILLFPNKEQKIKFLKNLDNYDPESIKLLLNILYSKVSLSTIDEYLGGWC